MKKDDPRTWDTEWAGPFGPGHGDRKARIPLNVSTNAIPLPNFIVIKDPETVPVPHASVALSLPWFLQVSYPALPNTVWHHGEEELGAGVNVSSQGLGLAPGGRSGSRLPCPRAMIPEATCGAEREVEVVKGNEALERCPTIAAASEEEET